MKNNKIKLWVASSSLAAILINSAFVQAQTTTDYPLAALRENRSGEAKIEWDITITGKAENCRVVESSGSPDLDKSACDLILQRARYRPATDASGNPIPSSDSRIVRFKTPE